MLRAILSVTMLFSLSARAGEPVDVTVYDILSGDPAKIIEAVIAANTGSSPALINLRNGPNGETTTEFVGPAEGSDGALPDISGDVIINGLCVPGPCILTLDPEQKGTARFASVSGDLAVANVSFKEFGIGIELTPIIHDGGAISLVGEGFLNVRDSRFEGNSTAGDGGALSVRDQAMAVVRTTVFVSNESVGSGTDVIINTRETETRVALRSEGNVIIGGIRNKNSIENPNGKVLNLFNSLLNSGEGINSTAELVIYLTPAIVDPNEQRQSNEGGKVSKPEAACNDFGTGAFVSAGWNISPDSSCNLNQPTDLPNTDAMLELAEDGVLVPMPGSPVIDSGPTDVVTLQGEDLPMLPCGYVDVRGNGRPQDANGDGVFECDRGAVEVQGAGAVVAAHSGPFYNALRDGEGTYVEILNATTALVYTFSYRPGGDGAAWFLGVGTIRGNSIVINDMIRPVGTSFGDGFNAADIIPTPAGGMSMVFPDCPAAAPGGVVAYNGNSAIGYEGLLTRSTRLGSILPCDGGAAVPNAGLSGSYFDLARDGGGIVVQWLSRDKVLVVFFTYDQSGNQLWLLGIGTPNGKSVTMDALYPAQFTSWGQAFDADEVSIETWGTFTLTWTACGAVTFEYDSTIEGFGTATRNYTRLSTLMGTSCPDF
jgi:hypothetical protein